MGTRSPVHLRGFDLGRELPSTPLQDEPRNPMTVPDTELSTPYVAEDAR